MDAPGDTTEQRGSGGRGGRRPRPDRASAAAAETEIQKRFQEYSKQYDDSNDRRERIIKRSRDITIGSKRLIFTLHRIYDTTKQEIEREMTAPIQRVREDILGLRKELTGQGYWKYEWSFTPGVQEYIEAVTFYHYLLHGDIPTIEQLSNDINSVGTDESVAPFSVSLKDYLLGVADMTGEAMRLAVNCVTKGDLETPKRVLSLLQQLYASFNTLPDTREIKDLENKLEVMKQSLQKVESLCLKVVVRRAEFPGQDILAGMDDDPDAMAE